MTLIDKVKGCTTPLLCLFVVSAASAQTLPNGMYEQTSFGALKIECISSDFCFGTYEDGKSFLYLTSRDHSQSFTGYWAETDSSRPCPETFPFPNLRTNAWGNVNVKFDFSANSLSGFWGYCDDRPNIRLDGARVKRDETNDDLTSLANRLVGSWLPTPDSNARRNDMYIFYPNGTFLISDGSSNSPLGTWKLVSATRMILDGRVDEPVPIAFMGQEIELAGTRFERTDQ